MLGRGGGGKRLPSVWKRAARSPHTAAPIPTDRRTEEVDTRNKAARVARVEAALWLAREPLTERRLTKVAGFDGVATTRAVLAEFRKRLAARRSAIEVVEVAGGLILMTRSVFAAWLDRFEEGTETISAARKLSHAAAETLAIVAYRQPVIRAEIEAIRGVGSAELLRQLLDANLLRIVGRSEELGKPLLYGTTGRFLELYGLGSLNDLPVRDEGTGSTGPTKDNAANDNAA